MLLSLSTVLGYVFIPERVGEQGSARDVKKKSKSGGICQSLLFMNEIEWGIFWDVFLIRFFLSFSSLVYRTNFSLLINEKFGVSQKTIGYLISFQVSNVVLPQIRK